MRGLAVIVYLISGKATEDKKHLKNIVRKTQVCVDVASQVVLFTLFTFFLTLLILEVDIFLPLSMILQV